MIAGILFAMVYQNLQYKGDHCGEYYVKFNDEYKKQVEDLIAGGMKRCREEAPI
jgi:hypothetical protein